MKYNVVSLVLHTSLEQSQGRRNDEREREAPRQLFNKGQFLINIYNLVRTCIRLNVYLYHRNNRYRMRTRSRIMWQIFLTLALINPPY